MRGRERMEFLADLNVWHWMILGVVLLGIEMLTGTFDLLMISIAAFLTGLFEQFVPGSIAPWQGQLIFFGVASIALFALGRTVFSNMRPDAPEHPTLNKRMNSLIGQRGTVSTAFAGGQGKVRIGDTEWLAESVDGSNFADGAVIVVEGAESTTVRVRAA